MKRLIALVEDTPKDARDIISHVQHFTLDIGVEMEVKWFQTGSEFLAQYHHIYDMVFLDINLAGVSGMDIAKILRKIDKQVILIFITSLAQYAVEGYEVSALDFMVKPVEYATFKRKMTRALSYCPVSQDDSLMLNLRDGVECRMTPARIKYIEIQDHSIVIHTTEGNLEAYGNLKKLESKLDPKEFVRSHRSYLVNLSFVTAVHGQMIVVGGEEIPLAKLKRNDFIQALNVHLRERR